MSCNHAGQAKSKVAPTQRVKKESSGKCLRGPGHPPKTSQKRVSGRACESKNIHHLAILLPQRLVFDFCSGGRPGALGDSPANSFLTTFRNQEKGVLAKGRFCSAWGKKVSNNSFFAQFYSKKCPHPVRPNLGERDKGILGMNTQNCTSSAERRPFSKKRLYFSSSGPF